MAKRTDAQKATDNTNRQSAASACETTMATLLTQLSTYLAAGSGDNQHSRKAVLDWAHWRLSTINVGQAPGYPNKNLSTLDFELATD